MALHLLFQHGDECVCMSTRCGGRRMAGYLRNRMKLLTAPALICAATSAIPYNFKPRADAGTCDHSLGSDSGLRV